MEDEIRHSYGYQMNPVTCQASDVLQHKTDYCFAKSHLLAAVNAQFIPPQEQLAFKIQFPEEVEG